MIGHYICAIISDKTIRDSKCIKLHVTTILADTYLINYLKNYEELLANTRLHKEVVYINNVLNLSKKMSNFNPVSSMTTYASNPDITLSVVRDDEGKHVLSSAVSRSHISIQMYVYSVYKLDLPKSSIKIVDLYGANTLDGNNIYEEYWEDLKKLNQTVNQYNKVTGVHLFNRKKYHNCIKWEPPESVLYPTIYDSVWREPVKEMNRNEKIAKILKQNRSITAKPLYSNTRISKPCDFLTAQRISSEKMRVFLSIAFTGDVSPNDQDGRSIDIADALMNSEEGIIFFDEQGLVGFALRSPTRYISFPSDQIPEKIKEVVKKFVR